MSSLGFRLKLFYQLAHVIQTRRIHRRHKLGGLHSPLGEDLPGEGGVADLHDLVVSGKDDLMLAHDGAAPDSGDADLLLVPGLADGVALKDILSLMPAASAIIRAVPLGASTLRRWCRSTISMS